VSAKFRFSRRSLKALAGVHPDLIAVARLGLRLSPHDFVVTEGVRSIDRQRELVEAGASRTMHSKHLTGEAFDFAVLINGRVTWDFARYREVAHEIKRGAEFLGVSIKWGGDFKSFRDGPHIQLETK